MTDVQVSNARRIGFTALALVAFGVVVWGTHHVADAIWGVVGTPDRILFDGPHVLQAHESGPIFAALLASATTACTRAATS